MLKFGAKLLDGAPMFGIGLSQENIARLLAGEPIFVPMSDWYPGMPGRILIMAGETEEAMQAEIEQALEEHDTRRSPETEACPACGGVMEHVVGCPEMDKPR